MARLELEKMGPMKRAERILISVFVARLGLWIFGRVVGVHGTTASLAGFGVLIVSGGLTWDVVCREEKTWNSLIWVGALVMMASYLSESGTIWWRLGALVSLVHIVIWPGVGGLWWKALGLW